MKNKVLAITGTRAEYGLLRPALCAIEKSEHLELHVLTTGMHLLPLYGNTLNEVKTDLWTHLHVVSITPKNTMTGWLSIEISGIENVCASIKPDLILVLGDRDEPLAGAVVGAHLGIPVAHIHGGDITGNVTVDDRIRDAITSFSDLHFPASQESANRIKQILGHKSKEIYLAGNLSVEEITDLIDQESLARKYHLSIHKPWILFVMHPSPLEPHSFTDQIKPALKALENLDIETISVYPNSDTGSQEFLKEMQRSRILTNFIPSLPHKDYLSFLKHSHCAVGNSSSLVLEAPLFKTYVVNIGHRQEGRRIYLHMTTVPYDVMSIRSAILKYLKLAKIASIPKLPAHLPSEIIVSHIKHFLYDTKNT